MLCVVAAAVGVQVFQPFGSVARAGTTLAQLTFPADFQKGDFKDGLAKFRQTKEGQR